MQNPVYRRPVPHRNGNCATHRCEACGKRLTDIKQTGRGKKYCDVACRVAAHRHQLNFNFNGRMGLGPKPLRNPQKNTEKTKPFLVLPTCRGSAISAPRNLLGGYRWPQASASPVDPKTLHKIIRAEIGGDAPATLLCLPERFPEGASHD